MGSGARGESFKEPFDQLFKAFPLYEVRILRLVVVWFPRGYLMWSFCVLRVVIACVLFDAVRVLYVMWYMVLYMM